VRTASIIASVFLLLSADAACPNAPERTPSRWSLPGNWTFALTDAQQHSLGELSLNLTGEVAETCSGGLWRRAQLKSSTLSLLDLKAAYAHGEFFPAYKIQGRRLELELLAPSCEDSLVLSGTLGAEDAEGRFSAAGTHDNKPLGSFSAQPTP
jgi:hypothetical protein